MDSAEKGTQNFMKILVNIEVITVSKFKLSRLYYYNKKINIANKYISYGITILL